MRRQGQGVVRCRWAVVAAVAVLVGGCTGEPVPERTTVAATPSASASPVPSPPPRPEMPVRPQGMDEPTAAGATAAATHFFELYDYAFSTGDAGPLRALSAESCTYCNEVVQQVQQAVDDRLLTERDPSEITDVSVVEVRPGEWFTVELRRFQGEIRLRGDDGSVVATEPKGAPLDYGLALSWTDDRWTVDEVGLTAAPG
ncbi:DUF6318 family protein [Cellulomonas xiejunii]|nr:DUF6318 family protein [Cellulomonas xiejunii]